MALTNHYKRIPCADITVNRATRQRRDLKLDSGLRESIKMRGVINPIVVTNDLILVAGERRLATSLELGLPDIPCRFVEELDPLELSLIELEENLKRVDLSWQDQARAILAYHRTCQGIDSEWSRKQTAEAIGLTMGHVNENIRVAKAISEPRIATMSTLREASNILSRKDARLVADSLSSILTAGKQIFAGLGAKVMPQVIGDDIGYKPPSFDTKPEPLPQTESILNEDFLKWAPSYTGEPFNFIHCDFPYGTNNFSGIMSGRDRNTNYTNKRDTYWDLLDCLCKNLDNIMTNSGHIMFWFSMSNYTTTIEFFHRHAPDLDFSLFPLIWLKSDNVGILPDAKRGPRRIYETALIASREDKYIVKPISNAYSAPTDKLFHTSTKPEPVLRHFFQMFVDETTRMLDPTCGSGSSLRAAESLGASQVMGLEIDPEHFANAQVALKNFRLMRKVA